MLISIDSVFILWRCDQWELEPKESTMFRVNEYKVQWKKWSRLFPFLGSHLALQSSRSTQSENGRFIPKGTRIKCLCMCVIEYADALLVYGNTFILSIIYCVFHILLISIGGWSGSSHVLCACRVITKHHELWCTPDLTLPKWSTCACIFIILLFILPHFKRISTACA